MLPLGATQQILQPHNKPDFSTFQNQFNSYLNLLFQYPLTQISKDERKCIFIFSNLGPHAFTFYFKFLPHTFTFYLKFSRNTFTFYFIILFNFFFKLGTITFNFHFSSEFQGLLNLKSGFWIPFWPRCNTPKVSQASKYKVRSWLWAPDINWRHRLILQNANLKTTIERYS